MAVNLKVDTSGNVNIDGSQYTNYSAKNCGFLFAWLLTQIDGANFAWASSSNVKDVNFDTTTGSLTWIENGSSQSQVLNDPTMNAAIEAVKTAVSSAPDPNVDNVRILTLLRAVLNVVSSNNRGLQYACATLETISGQSAAVSGGTAEGIAQKIQG